jgi:hypothetical protein
MLALLAMAAQAKGLGPAAGKLASRQDGDIVHIGVALTDDELKTVLSAVDTGPAPPQDAGPHGP